MNESFLQYIWQAKLFDFNNLHDISGHKIEILNFGTRNNNSGPDFLNANIKLDETVWFGHIEIHVFSSKWKDHGHQNDPNYKNVILHVVWQHNKEVQFHSDALVPTIELKGKVAKHVLSNLELLIEQNNDIPCAKLSPQKVSASLWKIWLVQLHIARLQRKVEWVQNELFEKKMDWNSIFMTQLFRSFGMQINSTAFEELSKRLDYNVLSKCSYDKELVLSYFLGSAGMLEGDLKGEYPIRLKQKFEFIQQKYGVKEMTSQNWHYSKLHPSNFPDLRMAQLAEIYASRPHLFSSFLESLDLRQIIQFFESIRLDSFWNSHYRLKNESAIQIKKIGKQTIHSLIINAISPILFLYGKVNNLEHLMDYSLNLLTKIPPEQNFVTRKWKMAGIKPQDAQESQALIELYKEYCTFNKCLNCQIGHQIIKNTTFLQH